MNFKRQTTEDPEVNLIPLIDVLLVILIFLMISTTYSKFTQLKISLPTADAEKLQNHPQEIIVAVSSSGEYAVNKQVLPGRTVGALTQSLLDAAKGKTDTMVVISADAQATQQSVVNVMEAARAAGLSRLTFATQRSPGS
ncbi:ExbD/TolR family protein [Thiomonas bhubaneswarensis]|uniref:Biopolymer transport protein ExbD n=1 Tax=Thiomonas bhubaneswarensis TaxID=339866 RepID=A0A0K6IBS2_9BURK|nr:biopolymer transporter ExbD [Thiomonas bhubaneswarensis]CUB00551.1 Biopolymer transport protein ExbD [Thiomonas bhubaneswarensis]